MDPKSPLDAMPRRRRGLSWRLFMAIVVAMLLAMAAVGWVIGGRGMSPLAIHSPPTSPKVETAVAVEPIKPPAPPPPRKIQVNSVAPASGYPLSNWNLENVSSGFTDAVTFAGTQIDAAAVGMLQDSDTIALTGWAGDTDLGMPFRRVVFSMCERVVGAAPVGLPRPDVAQQVHPNLTNPGWTATLLIGHLPRCDHAKLAAWAVAPFGRILFPLAGAFEFPLKQPGGIDPTIEIVSEAPIRPEEVDTPTGRVSIDVKSTRVNLRRCGDAACKVVGSLPRGKHSAIRLDERDQWSLVVVPRHATGWIADSAAKVTPATP